MIRLHPRFEPLVTSDTRYKIITGGRGSGKSYSTATLILLESDNDDGTILYTRFTLKNAEQSIFPEFEDKIDELGWRGKFHKSGNDYINLESGGKILFRGIKTSDGINTAALKSIPKLKMWVNDESEELVDETIFDTIDLSIRDAQYKLQIWLILNPSDVNHFIYRKFFKGNGVFDVWNGIRDNVTYIHTTYLDNKHITPTFYNLADKCKAADINKYDNLYLGKWRKLSEGNIYKDWERIEDKDYPINLPCWYGIDWGFSNDPMAIVRLCFDADTHTIYIKELCYEKGRLTSFAADVVRRDILNKETLLYEGEDWKIVHRDCKCWIGEQSYYDSQILEDDAIIPDNNERTIVRQRLGRLLKLYEEVYCDPARPEQIYEMRTQHDINSIPATNTDKVGRIEYLKYFNVKYVGDNIAQEYEGYKWQTNKKDMTIYINKPQDGNDHCFTADTMITTNKGQRKIIDIRENIDRVLTSQGYKKVFKLWDNGEKEIWRVRLSFTDGDIVLNVTPNHKIKTLQGWKEIQQIKAGELLCVQPYLMEKPTIYTKGLNTSRSTIKSYIGKCGNIITEIFQKGIRYTIKMVIALIILLITLFAYLWQSIIDCTQKMKEQGVEMKKRDSMLIQSVIRQQSGIEAKRVESGTDFTQSKCNQKNIIALVLCAVRNIFLKRKALFIAAMRVMQKQGGKADWIIRKGLVLFAEELIQLQSMEVQKPAVVMSVLKRVSVEKKEKKEVYDLTIDDVHEYYANGVLVHNCMDAINYGAVTHLRRLRVANKIGEN